MTGTFMPSFSSSLMHVELDAMLTNFLLNSPTSNRLRGTSRALNRKSQNMTCVPSTVVPYYHDADAGVNQNKNAGSGGDGDDDED